MNYGERKVSSERGNEAGIKGRKKDRHKGKLFCLKDDISFFQRAKFIFFILWQMNVKMCMPCGLKDKTVGSMFFLYSMKLEIKVPTDKLNIL